ncbi:P-loop containing nucleoside triphosphate hydrolase protein [Amylostereum chailletii]|nr:P-loop containing nucleoside triphosphate hydrolase protein [Amylostereum chailletii]
MTQVLKSSRGYGEIRSAEPEPYSIGEHIVAASTKLTAVDKLLADIIPRGERVLIFSQWTGMLDLLEDFMHLRGIKYGRLDGGTSRARRALDIKLFQQEKSPYDVFLISTKAGGLGISLTKANHVIMFDRDWNPQNDLQAIARAHRIGQTKTVKVYHLICAGSVEDQMLDRIRRKLFLSLKVMGSDTPSSESDSTALKTDDLMSILRRGTGALADGQTGMELNQFLHASIGQILAESNAREGLRETKLKKEVKAEPEGEMDPKLLADAEEEERRLMSGVAQVHSRLFEGKIVQRAKENPTTHSRQWLGVDNKKIAKEWEEVQKRARYERLVTVDGMQFIADRIGAEPLSVSVAIPAAPKRKKAKFEHEDWCIHCRDGGELFLCGHCPRVFHAKCRGMSAAQARSAFGLTCTQHACVGCERSVREAGGMLFRCQTCPDAYCEDCLPEDTFSPIGETIPTFLIRGYGVKSSSYYINCPTCVERFREEPQFQCEWEDEIRQAKEALERE